MPFTTKNICFLFVSETARSKPDQTLEALQAVIEPYSRILTSTDVVEAVQLILTTTIHAIFLLDPKVSDDNNCLLWPHLNQYVLNGGTVIIGGWRWREVSNADGDGLFIHIFLLPWRFGELIDEPLKVEITLFFGQRLISNIIDNDREDLLPMIEYETSGKLLSCVQDGSMIYVPTGQGLEHCMTCMGANRSGGSLCYIGDSEMSDETKRVYCWILGIV